MAPQEPAHAFDLKYGVDTSGKLYQHELRSGKANDEHITGYVPTPPAVFYPALYQWKRTLPDLGLSEREYHFVDVGCGKGRVLLLAAESSFLSVDGIEIHPATAEIAKSNAARRKDLGGGDPEITVQCLDVMDFEVPAGPVVFYLYRPFQEILLRRWVEKLDALASRQEAPIDLILLNVVDPETFAKPCWSLLWSGLVGADKDGMGVTTGKDPNCLIYRLYLDRNS